MFVTSDVHVKRPHFCQKLTHGSSFFLLPILVNATYSEVFRHNLHIIFWSFSSQSSYYILIHSFSSQSSYYILIHSFQLFTILTHSWIIEDKKLNYKVVCYVNIKNCAYIVIFILNPKSQIMRQLQRKTSKHFAFSETFVKK